MILHVQSCLQHLSGRRYSPEAWSYAFVASDSANCGTGGNAAASQGVATLFVSACNYLYIFSKLELISHHA
jgi:hypothetical protein